MKRAVHPDMKLKLYTALTFALYLGGFGLALSGLLLIGGALVMAGLITFVIPQRS